MQAHHTDITLASIPVAIGLAKLMEILIKAQPILADISYIVAVVAGLVTIYFKFKNKG